MSGRRNWAPWFQVQQTSRSAKYLSAQVSHLVAAACLDNFSMTKISPKGYPRHDICFSLLLEVWCKERVRCGGTWLSGFGILRSKGGHQGVAYFSVPSDSGQHTESGVLFLCAHTAAQLVSVAGLVWGWELGSSWLGDVTLPRSKQSVLLLLSSIYFSCQPWKGKEDMGRGLLRFWGETSEKNSPYVWHSQAASWRWLGGGPSTPYQAIPLPHGDDEAVVTTGRCHVPRIFFFSGKRLWFDILPDTWLQRGPDGWAVSFWASGTQCLWKLHLCSWASAVPAQERLWNKKRGKK